MVLPLILAGVGIVAGVAQGIAASRAVKESGKQAVAQAQHQARQYRRQAKFQARDIMRQGKVQAKNFLTQAAIHKRQAGLIRDKGSYDAARMTEGATRIVAGQIASTVSSGVTVTGTVADVVRSTGESAAMDIAAARFSTRVAEQNEIIQGDVNRTNAKDTLKYSRKAAEDSIKFGEQAAKDSLKYGAVAGAAAKQAAPLAFAAPVISSLGNFATSGIFNG